MSCSGDSFKLVALLEHDHDAPSLDDDPASFGDQFQDTGQVGLGADGNGDRLRRLEASYCALQSVLTLVGGGQQPSMIDRDRRPLGEHRGGLLVAGVKRAVLLVGEIQVAPRRSRDHDRHPEERPHRRMPGGEPERVRMGCQVRES